MTDQTEQAAERIAGRSRELLVERIRAAYRNAAKAHSDILALDEERIEAMVQRSVERADGLQWRRALATAGAEELGVSETEALSDPAVRRAQELVGAPSDEPAGAVPPAATAAAPPAPEPASESTAEPDGIGVDEAIDEAEAIDEDEDEDEAVDEAEEAEVDAEPGPPAPTHSVPATPTHSIPAARGRAEAESIDDAYADVDSAPAVQTDRLRVTAIHLGGVANLPASHQGIDLRLSGDGLDILRGEEEILGRLPWAEIDALEVPRPRARRRRKGVARARLVVRTKQGDASFEIPAFSSDELRERLNPLIDRFGR